MSSLDKYLTNLQKKHVGETAKQKAKRIAKEKSTKAAITAEKNLIKAARAVRKRNTAENRARVKRDALRLGKWLKKTYNL